MQFPHPNLTSRYGKWDDHEPIIILEVWIATGGFHPKCLKTQPDVSRLKSPPMFPWHFCEVSDISWQFTMIYSWKNNLQTWVFPLPIWLPNVGLFSPGQGAPCPVKLAAPDVAPRWSFPNEPRQGWATEAMVIDDGSDRDFRGKTMENHGE